MEITDWVQSKEYRETRTADLALHCWISELMALIAINLALFVLLMAVSTWQVRAIVQAVMGVGFNIMTGVGRTCCLLGNIFRSAVAGFTGCRIGNGLALGITMAGGAINTTIFSHHDFFVVVLDLHGVGRSRQQQGAGYKNSGYHLQHLGLPVAGQ